MPLIPPKRLRESAQLDRVARLMESLAFARYCYNLVIRGLVAEEERHGLIHFTATNNALSSHSVLPSFLGHLVVLLL